MEDARQTEAESSSFPIKTILIVEDDQDLGSVLSDFLIMETGYQVVVVPDGLQALDLIRSVQPNLFVLDYHLPGMDGLTLASSLRAMQAFERTPMFLISARPPWSKLTHHQLLCLEKPFDFDVFVRQVKTLLT